MARRLGFFSAGLSLALACGHGETARPPQIVAITPRSDVPRPIAPPTEAPATEHAQWLPGIDFSDLGDGRLGAVVNGRRVVVGAGKASVLDGASLPDGAPAVSLPPCLGLPPSLGGGWLFVRETSLYFSRAFDSEVRVVVEGMTDPHVGIGYGSVLVEVAGGKKRLVELATGRVLPSPVPDLAEIFSLASGEVAARTKSGALYLARRHDTPFTKIATARPVDRLASFENEFVLHHGDHEERLTRDGRLHRPPPEAGDIPATENLWALHPHAQLEVYERRADALPGVRMLDEGTVAMSPAIVLGVRDHDLLVFDARTGRASRARAGIFAAFDRCYLVRGGRPVFVACEGPGPMKLSRIDDPTAPMVEERTFAKTYNHAELGQPTHEAPIVIRRRCNGDEANGSFCVRQKEGSWADIPPPPDPDRLLDSIVSIEKVAADADGTPYGLARQKVSDDLILVDGRANAVKRIVRREAPAFDYRSFLSSSFTVIDGEVHVLFPGEHPGVLILRRDGRVDARTLTGHMASVGRRALLVSDDGALRETLDGGETFHDVTPPPGGADRRTLSCEEGGCHVGPWLRLGWGP